MQGTVYAQKLTSPCPAAFDPDFTAAFYRPYEAAAQTALILLDDTRKRLKSLCGRDSVRVMTYRLKSPSSIRGKLTAKGLPASPAAAAALRDIAGLRAVLTDEESVYKYAGLILQSPAVLHVSTHDYIADPKPSGYRSLHLLLQVPVNLRGQMYMTPVEIQLRTTDMDVWASIDHEICYKPVSQA